MRHRTGRSFSRRHRRKLVRWLMLAALVLLVLAGAYGCAVQKMVYSSRGTMIFLPGGP